MSKTLIQKTTFSKTTPKRLYDIYLSADKHAAAIGSERVTIEKKVGGRITAFMGMIRGKFIYLEKNKMIVQTWRSKTWKKRDSDSILILSFKKVKGGASINLTHVNIPEHDYLPIKKGWKSYYWDRWRTYLKG